MKQAMMFGAQQDGPQLGEGEPVCLGVQEHCPKGVGVVAVGLGVLHFPAEWNHWPHLQKRSITVRERAWIRGVLEQENETSLFLEPDPPPPPLLPPQHLGAFHA